MSNEEIAERLREMLGELEHIFRAIESIAPIRTYSHEDRARLIHDIILESGDGSTLESLRGLVLGLEHPGKKTKEHSPILKLGRP